MTEEYVPVRLSHLLRDCSVGAVVRGPDSLMVVQDIRTWDRPGADPLEREIRYVDRGAERARYRPRALRAAAFGRAGRGGHRMDPGAEVSHLDALPEVRLDAPCALASTASGRRQPPAC